LIAKKFVNALCLKSEKSEQRVSASAGSFPDCGGRSDRKRGDLTQRHRERRVGAKVAAPPTPGFFVSVASTGVRFPVSLLFAALARESASVASKGFTDADCWQEGNWMRADDFGGVRRTARRERMNGGHERTVPTQQNHYSKSVLIVK